MPDNPVWDIDSQNIPMPTHGSNCICRNCSEKATEKAMNNLHAFVDFLKTLEDPFDDQA